MDDAITNGIPILKVFVPERSKKSVTDNFHFKLLNSNRNYFNMFCRRLQQR